MTQLAESPAIEPIARPSIDSAPLPAARRIRARLGAIVVAHTAVDVYSAFVPPLLGVLQVRCHLSNSQSAWLLGIGSVTSGISQPISAWLSDRMDSRIAGALGLAVAAACLSCIGMAHSFWSLVALFGLGMIGSGVFHPTGASSMGQMAGRRRSLSISVFHVAGMIGGITGSILVTRIAGMREHDGFALLRWLMLPGLGLAIVLHLAIRNIPHRSHAHLRANVSPDQSRLRWRAVWVLFAANAMRFTVNMAIVYLFVRWAQAAMARLHPTLAGDAIATAAAPINGNLNALLIIGMALGGVSASALVRKGREKWPMVWSAVLLAPAVAAFPHAGLPGAYALAILGGAGFACMVPVTIGLAQRLLPHRTSLASGLMLGGSWTLAFIGPRAAEWCLGTMGMSLGATFGLTAVLLVLSGLVCLLLDARVLGDAAAHH